MNVTSQRPSPPQQSVALTTHAWYSPAGLWQRKPTVIAVLSLAGIFSHLALRFGLHAPKSVFRQPLLAILVIAVGGMALSVIGMILAATGHLNPVSGAITQEVIDVLAVLNALRAAFPPRVIHDL